MLLAEMSTGGTIASLNEQDYHEATTPQAITVASGLCPITGRPAFALYQGDLPVVPATIFLRHLGENEGLAPNTVLAYAYALKSFFSYLQHNSLSFWTLTPAAVKQFKKYHLRRADAGGDLCVKRRTVQQYLNMVKGLVHYWRGLCDHDPFFHDTAAETDGRRVRTRGRGLLLHSAWYSRVPDSLWRVRIPIAERRHKRYYKGLTGDESRRVMEVLNRAPCQTQIETMLYYRDRAIWTFLLMSCLRKGELVRVRLEDANRHTGTVSLVDRPQDRWLGDLKSGPGDVFVSSNNPYWSYLESWLLHGRWIAADVLKSSGEEDHGMLFCNRDGGPLTQAAVDHLFDKLQAECGFGPETPFHPHIARHTTASLLLNSGVEITEVQRYLRHRSIQSTELYARVSDSSLRLTMEKFWGRFKVPS